MSVKMVRGLIADLSWVTTSNTRKEDKRDENETYRRIKQGG